MKAMVYTKYGPPEVLQLKEVEKPAPKDNEVLVKVHAASVNSWDWDNLVAKTIFTRLFFGFLKPKYNILGADIAGRVEAVGGNITLFKPGDEVYGDLSESGWGGFAEYVCAREDALALKPESMTFEEAAAVPQAAVMALQGIRDYGQVQPGQKVLINGAGGGVGTFAVQMAKSFGAEVTGVDSTGKLEMLRSIGADHVIDYTQEDFTKNGQRYDLILDVVVNRSIFDCRRALNPGGVFVMIGGTTPRIVQFLLLGAVVSKFGSRKMCILMHKPNKNLAVLKALFETGKVKSVMEKPYPLSKASQALRHIGEGRIKGKAIIVM